jgi:XTP/dITP diphosphohydrolase
MTPPRPRVVLATRNRHKVREIADLLAPLGIDLIGIDDLAPGVELREDEATFEGNALAKARQAGDATGLPSLADDSGLEVDALNGAPGVHSARYAGHPCDDARNNEKLLAALEAVPPARRSARYRCVAAFYDPGSGRTFTTAGSCEGAILSAPRGGGGFGYDPLFLVPGLARTMAEIELLQKNQLSHRAAAFKSMSNALMELLGPAAPTPRS